MSYYDQLKDPRWKILRMEIITARNGVCAWCGETPDKPEVHHGSYVKDLKLWEYPDSMLHVVCRDCHGMWQDDLQRLQGLIARLSPHSVAKLYGCGLLIERQQMDAAYQLAADNEYESAEGM